MRSGRLLASTVVAVAATVLAACSTVPAPGDGTGPTGDPVRGGTLVYGDVSPIAWPISGATRYTNVAVWNSLADTLLTLDADTYELVPHLATEWTVNADATEYTFTIRQGVTFSDGTPLTAEVVARNFDRWGKGDAELGFAPEAPWAGTYESAVGAGDVVTVRLNAPNRHVPRFLTQKTRGIVGDAYLALSRKEQADPRRIVASGPFVFDSEKPGEEVVLRRRDDYAWPAANDSNKGAAYLDKVVIKVVGELGLRAQALESGQVDVAKGVQPIDEERLQQAGFVIHANVAVLTAPDYLSLRPGNPALGDPRVRRALSIGFDRDALVRDALSPSYPAAYSLLPKGDPAYVSYDKELAYDPDEAKRLLDEAGWRPGADGIREKDGQKLEFSIAGSTQGSGVVPAAAYLTQQWKQLLGVRLINRTGDDTFFTTADASSDVGGKIQRSSLEAGLRTLFGPGNTSSLYDDPYLLERYPADFAAGSPEQVREVVEQLHRHIVLDQTYAIPLFDATQTTSVSPKVSITFTGYTAANFHEAWKTD
ncbi:ABC transporter substrate-binding protein [Nocardia sp. NPDC058176]|uniref:ABC transporter substrate-binding protein n=1 Tax=Nocardia sp. NPDC058176 TaxID=3346368 RepID=UPI0036DB5CC9